MAWNGGTVKALCDVYGRLYVNEQLISGENYFAGIAWNENGIVSEFNSDDEAFTQIILTYGCNDSVLSYNETSATVTINSEPVVFNFTDGQLVPVTSAWQQGSTPMFFYRTVNDGTNDVTVVCDSDGKLYVNDNDDYIKRVNDGFAWSTGAASQTLITNCGGKVAMDEAAGDDNLMTVISMDDYTVVFTEDGNVTVGEITEYQTTMLRVFNSKNYLVDNLGHLVVVGVTQPYETSYSIQYEETMNEWLQTGAPEVEWGTISVNGTYDNEDHLHFEVDGLEYILANLHLVPTPSEYYE